MKQRIINTAIYSRKPTNEEVVKGAGKRIVVVVPLKDVFLGVDTLGEAIFKKSVKGEDGMRYYYQCVNYFETMEL